MQNSHPDNMPVTWGRYIVAHTALESRIAVLEAGIQRLGASGARYDRMQQDIDQLTARAGQRKEHTWRLITILLTSLIMPTLILLVGIWLHRVIH